VKLKPKQKYKLIKDLQLDIGTLCKIAKVSRGGYYKWLKHCDEPEKDYDDYLLIKKVFERGKKKLGFRSVQMKLLEKQINFNHKKITRIMNKYGLICKIRRKNPYKNIMKKSQEHRTFENKLNRNFKQSTPFKIFCTDITYIPFNYRFAYLSVVKDIATGEIVSWKLSKHLEMDIVLGTLKNLKSNTLVSLKDVLIHSDQGVHYTNPEYISEVAKLGMIQSMSRKGNCIDNAPIESFFGHFKDDVDYKSCRTFEQLHLLIEEYVKYYNYERYQWDLKKMTPIEYRNHLLEFAR
jgi:putative transposase